MAAVVLAALAFWLPRDVSADLIQVGTADGQSAQIDVDATPLDRSAAGPAPTSYAPIIERAAPSVVNIVSARHAARPDLKGQRNPLFDDPFFRRYFDIPDEQAPGRPGPRGRRQEGIGSGVIVSPDGYIITNNHVIEGADEIRVFLGDNSQEFEATLVGTDPQSDIAVLKIDATDLPAVTLGDSSQLRVGDVVFAIGNPMGVGQTVTQGIVSAQGRALGIVDYEDFIQTDAAINPGNSGGALIDAQGRLIGINTAIVSRSGGNMGIGFAVPVNQARRTMESLMVDGRVSRGFLGITIQDIDHELQDAFGLPDMEGALVNSVLPDGSAAAAGVQTGDVIREFNGRKIRDVRHLRMLVSGTAPGRDVTFSVWRDGDVSTLTATLKELPGDDLAAATPTEPTKPARAGELIPGLDVVAFDPDRHAKLNLSKATHGLVITSVAADSAAAEAGLRAGDLIEQVNKRDVADLSEARAAIEAGDPHRILLYVNRDGRGQFVVVTLEG
jgi:serine protease Do